MYQTGVVVGKFWPVHSGHLHLIDTALAQCDQLHVGVVYDHGQKPTGDQRAAALEEIYGNLIIVDTLPNPPGKDEDSVYWAWYTERWLETIPDAVFTSEPYGDTWAEELTNLAKKLGQTNKQTVHVMVDLDRGRNPVSGTLVRSAPFALWDQLSPPIREVFARKVAIVGGESCGKTTITPRVASEFGASYTTEAGRDFVEKYGTDQTNKAIWGYILREQPHREAVAARTSPTGLVICDTDLLTTSVWYERWVGVDHWYGNVLDPIALEHSQSYEHYIIMSHVGVPWVNDGSRSEESNREFFTDRLIEKVEEAGIPYTVIDGDWNVRTRNVRKLVSTLAI